MSSSAYRNHFPSAQFTYAFLKGNLFLMPVPDQIRCFLVQAAYRYHCSKIPKIMHYAVFKVLPKICSYKIKMFSHRSKNSLGPNQIRNSKIRANASEFLA
jgi:hypothetical protein